MVQCRYDCPGHYYVSCCEHDYRWHGQATTPTESRNQSSRTRNLPDRPEELVLRFALSLDDFTVREAQLLVPLVADTLEARVLGVGFGGFLRD